MDATSSVRQGEPQVPYCSFNQALVGIAAAVVLVAGILALANVEGFNQLGKAGGITCVCLSGAVFSIPLLMKVYQCLRALRADPADKLVPVLERMISETKEWTGVQVSLSYKSGGEDHSRTFDKDLNSVRQFCAQHLGARHYTIELINESLDVATVVNCVSGAL